MSYEALEPYNRSLCEDLAALGKTATLTLGDFNHDPLTDPLNVQAAGSRGVVHYPTLPTSAEGGELQEPLPAPTRWTSNRCIDWGVRCNVQASVKYCFRTSGPTTKCWSGKSRACLLVASLATNSGKPRTCENQRTCLRSSGKKRWVANGLARRTEEKTVT